MNILWSTILTFNSLLRLSLPWEDGIYIPPQKFQIIPSKLKTKGLQPCESYNLSRGMAAAKQLGGE